MFDQDPERSENLVTGDIMTNENVEKLLDRTYFIQKKTRFESQTGRKVQEMLSLSNFWTFLHNMTPEKLKNGT